MDNFLSLEIELFKKAPSLKYQCHYYVINKNKIDISKTIEQNNITDGSIIYYKKEEREEREENNNEVDEEISVIIKSMNQDFKSSFLIKKSDKFKVLEQKLYERKPELKNKSLLFIYYGNAIDIKKTIEQNRIKDGGIIIYNINFDDFDEEI